MQGTKTGVLYNVIVITGGMKPVELIYETFRYCRRKPPFCTVAYLSSFWETTVDYISTNLFFTPGILLL